MDDEWIIVQTLPHGFYRPLGSKEERDWFDDRRTDVIMEVGPEIRSFDPSRASQSEHSHDDNVPAPHGRRIA